VARDTGIPLSWFHGVGMQCSRFAVTIIKSRFVEVNGFLIMELPGKSSFKAA
jgi:hypothetical protein